MARPIAFPKFFKATVFGGPHSNCASPGHSIRLPQIAASGYKRLQRNSSKIRLNTVGKYLTSGYHNNAIGTVFYKTTPTKNFIRQLEVNDDDISHVEFDGTNRFGRLVLSTELMIFFSRVINANKSLIKKSIKHVLLIQ